MKIEGSVALITGANRGIGAAFVKELLARGASTVYLGARDTATLQPLLLTSNKLVPLELDVTKPDQIAKAAEFASDITLLINNAGVAEFSGVLAAKDVAAARRETEVNHFGPLGLAQALRDTPAFHNGGIINILSFLSQVTLPVAGTYSASKSASLALTRTLRAELKARGVQVVAVMPVQVETEMGQALPEPRLKPSDVATESLDAIESGQDEVYPGALSKAAAQAFESDPVGLQSEMATSVHSID